MAVCRLKEFGWLNEQQFVDAVAVAMITPGPVVITVGFIGYYQKLLYSYIKINRCILDNLIFACLR
jgi:chromate transport protein ChrA